MPPAAAAYAYLAATFPEAVQADPRLAVRPGGHASQADSAAATRDLDLFARTFRDPSRPAHVFRAAAVEFRRRRIHLSRAQPPSVAPGRFPEPLGPTTRRRARRSCWRARRRRRTAGRKDAALDSVEVLLSWRRRACRGTTAWPVCTTAAATWTGRPRCWPAGTASTRPITGRWSARRSSSSSAATPQRRAEAIDRALGLTQGRQRAAVAFLGARLAIQAGFRRRNGEETHEKNTDAAPPDPAALAHAAKLLQECLSHDPNHVDALWCLAAVRSASGDREGLASQAPAMDRPAVKDAAVPLPRRRLLPGGAGLRQGGRAEPAGGGRRPVADRREPLRHGLGPPAPEQRRRRPAVAAEGGGRGEKSRRRRMPARCWAGRASTAAAYDEAVRWWKEVDPARRAEWAELFSLAAEPGVSWLGAVEDVREVWRRAAIAILPSTYGEGVPKALLEAAACARPIVASDVPGCREAVRIGENESGILVPPRDSVRSPRRSRHSPPTRAARRDGQNGRVLIETRFAEEIVARETLSLYRIVLAERAVP